jgi:hypothetical protein
MWTNLNDESYRRYITNYLCEGNEVQIEKFNKFLEINGFDRMSNWSYDCDVRLKQTIRSGVFSKSYDIFDNRGLAPLPGSIDTPGCRMFKKGKNEKICLVAHETFNPVQKVERIMRDWAEHYKLTVKVYDGEYSWSCDNPTALIIVTASDDVDIKVM